MNSSIDRDKYLNEAMGEEFTPMPNDLAIGEKWYVPTPNNFSTWDGFGKLWEWSTKQVWWCDFKDTYGFSEDQVNPNKFANFVYSYLKEKENKNLRKN